MPLIEKATAYILDTVLQNEEFKKFPQDFITASVRWVRSWFLEDDPKTEAKLSAPDKSKDYKQGVVESRLEDLLENPQFKQELETKLAEYERHAASLPSISNRTNTIEGSSIHTGGGDFTQKSENYQAQGNISIVHHHHAPTPPVETGTAPAAPPPLKLSVPAGTKRLLQDLIGQDRTGDAIRQLSRLSEANAGFHSMVLAQSGRWEQLRKEVMIGTLSYSEAGRERAKIVSAVLGLIGDLEE
jgi:hypothetical protein